MIDLSPEINIAFTVRVMSWAVLSLLRRIPKLR
jgi:hypothetical protein